MVFGAGFVVGGGGCDAPPRKGGKTVSFHRTTGVSFGLQGGAQSTAVFLLFMTDDALRKFEASDGWTVGADASVVVVDKAADATVSTQTAEKPVLAFVRNQSGLMANLSIDGSKFNKLKL